MSAQPEAAPMSHGAEEESSGRALASMILLAIALVGAIVALFFRPFLIALPILILTMVGVTISDKHRRFGLIVMFAIILGFVIGAAFAVWDSRPLY